MIQVSPQVSSTILPKSSPGISVRGIGGLVLVLWLSACQALRPTANAPADGAPVLNPPPADTEITRAGGVRVDTTDRDSTGRPVWAAKKYRYNPERTRSHDLVHTRLDVRFDWGRQHLNGVATLTLKPHFYPQDTLRLDAKGFDLRRIQLVDQTKRTQELRYAYDGRVITIPLDRTYTRNEKFTVRIDYTAKPNDLPKGGSQAITADKGLYFINPDGSQPGKPRQIWTQGETEASSCWFPTIDSPNQKTTQEMYLTVDAPFRTLSNGTLEYSRNNADGTRTDYWKMDQPHAPYLFMVAVGEFAVVKDKWKNTEVNYYVEPAFEQYARSIFGNTPEMIGFFAEKLGVAFPWDKYAQVVVRDFVSGAMENTTATVHMEDLQVDNRALLDENWDYIIAHELFHQWFGDLVTLESWANLPLNESFANYAEYLWNEHKYGVDEADFKGQEELEGYLSEAEDKREPLIRYHYRDREDMFDAHSYNKGGRVLHMLRQYVGDEAFFAALKGYLEEHRFATVEIHDLRMAFEKVTGEDLNWFFNQWFLSPGHAQLAVTQRYADGKVTLNVTQQQDSLYTPIYRLPLKVDVWVGGRKTRYEVVVDRATQTLSFPAAAPPDLVIFDAGQQLVGTIDHPKSTPELVFQYYHADTYLAKYGALTKLEKKLGDAAVQRMMRDAMDDPFWKIRQLAVGAFYQYDGEQSAALREKLKTLALRDPRSYVRAEALGILGTLPGSEPDYPALCRQALGDSSYTVAATALFAYLSGEPADAEAQTAKFEQLDNDEITMALASYYADRGDSAKYDWLAGKMNRATGSLLYQLTQTFGVYLLKQPAETQRKGGQVLARIARDHDAYAIRFVAFQSLSLIKEAAGVEELRKQIRARETDPRLIEAYEGMK
ncbi:MAG: M1 family peptidase [Ferruginibacter sp.]|nr:M1 family peptidase [Cytophagales bacterium]